MVTTFSASRTALPAKGRQRLSHDAGHEGLEGTLQTPDAISQYKKPSQAVVVHAFNPRPREEYKIGGDSSLTQSHSEIPGGRIAISD